MLALCAAVEGLPAKTHRHFSTLEPAAQQTARRQRCGGTRKRPPAPDAICLLASSLEPRSFSGCVTCGEPVSRTTLCLQLASKGMGRYVCILPARAKKTTISHGEL